MGWTNSPPIFSAATETIADMANARLRHATSPPLPHHLDDLAQSIPSSSPGPIQHLAGPVPRDPSLPSPPHPLAYVDVFVDDFIGAAQNSTAAAAPIQQSHPQGTQHPAAAAACTVRQLNPHDTPCADLLTNCQQVRRTLLHLLTMSSARCTLAIPRSDASPYPSRNFWRAIARGARSK
jgi:hypothetical protein